MDYTALSEINLTEETGNETPNTANLSLFKLVRGQIRSSEAPSVRQLGCAVIYALRITALQIDIAAYEYALKHGPLIFEQPTNIRQRIECAEKVVHGIEEKLSRL